MREKAAQGLFPAGRVPFGYLLDQNTHTLYPDPLRAPLVVEMYVRYANRQDSFDTLAAWAKDNCVTRQDSRKPINRSQIHRILTNEIYLGKFSWARKLYDGKHEPIITRELFEAARQAANSYLKPKAWYKALRRTAT